MMTRMMTTMTMKVLMIKIMAIITMVMGFMASKISAITQLTTTWPTTIHCVINLQCNCNNNSPNLIIVILNFHNISLLMVN
jgi:cell division protein FtsX